MARLQNTQGNNFKAADAQGQLQSQTQTQWDPNLVVQCWRTIITSTHLLQGISRQFVQQQRAAISLVPISLNGFKRTHCSWSNFEILVGVGYICILLHCLAVTPKKVLGRKQPLNTDGTSSVDAACGYAHLRTETVAEAIAEASRRVDVDACTVYFPQEFFS